ncbi:MAG: hypothetical protein RIQ53_4365 [Pseudomonadota bacterium]
MSRMAVTSARHEAAPAAASDVPVARVAPVPGSGPSGRPSRVAVVGAGLAGCTLARALADAGRDVTVLDKARGPGGRLSTRRVEPQGWTFDHGAVALGARAPAWRQALAGWAAQGAVAAWSPRLAPDSVQPLDGAALWVGLPGMAGLCRHLLHGQTDARPLELLARHQVLALERDADGRWWLPVQRDEAAPLDGEARAAALPQAPRCGPYDTVVLSLPPAQAASLLDPWRADWAHEARSTVLRPAWSLMAVVDDGPDAPDWALAWPADGPLAVLARDDVKPGRAMHPGQQRWVIQSTADWSAQHLADRPEAVADALVAAAGRWLGPRRWLHTSAHRWAYATSVRAMVSPERRARWDAALGLGLCGEALGGGGAEGAWASAQAAAAVSGAAGS